MVWTVPGAKNRRGSRPRPPPRPAPLQKTRVSGQTLCTQKALFTLPGLGVAGLAWVIFGGPREYLKRRLSGVRWFSLGLLIPFLATWAWFATHQAGWVFIENNFLLNARWKAAEPPQPLLQQLVSDSWPILLLAGGGVLLLGRDFVSNDDRSRRRESALLFEANRMRGLTSATTNFVQRRPDWLGLVFLASASGLLLGLLVIPVAYAQYLLTLLPLITLFAGRFLVFLAGYLPSGLRWAYVGLALILLQISPVSQALERGHRRNDGQLRSLEFVLTHTTPTDQVMDGWRGLGVFRPHAWYYYFLHPEVRGMLPPAELAGFQEQLESGAVQPKLIVMDNNLRSLSDRFLAFVQSRYEKADRDIWIRKPEE